MNIRDWKGNHPVSNSLVVGTIVILTEQNNVDFKSAPETKKANETQKTEYKVSEDIEGEDW